MGEVSLFLGSAQLDFGTSVRSHFTKICLKNQLNLTTVARYNKPRRVAGGEFNGMIPDIFSV